MSISQKDIIKMMQDFDKNETDWAKNSKFYHRIMSDGNIFNPYLHRRFLPTQFNSLVTRVFLRGGFSLTKRDFIDRADRYCPANHVIDCITKEIGLLAFLEDKDPIAFEERSAIMPLEKCKQAYIELFNYLKSHCSKIIYGTNCLDEDMEVSCRAIAIAETYSALDKALHDPWKTPLRRYTYTYNKVYFTAAKVYQAYGTNWRDDYPYVGCKEFYNLYLLAGAYYSLKNYYMFNDEVQERRPKLKALYDITLRQRDWGDLINRYCRVMSINGNIKEEKVA